MDYLDVPTVISIGVKGGTGKSLQSANISMALARKGYTVGLIDADVDSPNLPEIMNLAGQDMVLDDERRFVPVKWGPRIHMWSMGCFYSKGGKTMAKLGEDNRQILNDGIHHTRWPDDIDVFVVDLPAGLSDETRAILSNMRKFLGACIITQPATLSDLERAVEVCQHFGVPIVGVTENMGYVECKCGEKIYPFRYTNDERTAASICDELKVFFAGTLPLVPLRRGEPRIPKGHDEAVRNIVGRIVEKLNKKDAQEEE